MFPGLIATKRFPFVGRPAPSPDRAARRPARRRLLLAVAGLALLLSLLLVPAVSVGAQSAYPANTIISTYFDARYGEVSVVTDASGNLIDINAVTGQRIYPIYADYAPAVPYNVPAVAYNVPASVPVPYYALAYRAA